MAEVQRRKEEEAKRKEEMRKANGMDFQGVWMVVYCVYTSPTSIHLQSNTIKSLSIV